VDSDPTPDSSWLTRLGITDRATGMAEAAAARERLLAAGRRVLKPATDYTIGLLVFSGLLARAQGLHEGSLLAIQHDNPHAAFTLIRAYAENAAAVLYLKDNPENLDRFLRGDVPSVPIGKITNYAVKRFEGFKGMYVR
jgi:hypothetical protein